MRSFLDKLRSTKKEVSAQGITERGGPGIISISGKGKRETQISIK